jgi:hypothetical protein
MTKVIIFYDDFMMIESLYINIYDKMTTLVVKKLVLKKYLKNKYIRECIVEKSCQVVMFYFYISGIN